MLLVTKPVLSLKETISDENMLLLKKEKQKISAKNLQRTRIC